MEISKYGREREVWTLLGAFEDTKFLGSSGEIASACLWEFWEYVFRRLRICIWRFKDGGCFVCVGGDRHYKDTLEESSR